MKNNPLAMYEIAKSFDIIAPNKEQKSIKANNDIDAIKTWLTEFSDSPNTFISYRQTSERFILWCIQRNLKLSSVAREDIQDYQAFLLSPSPHEFWCGASKPRNSKDWKPFVKGLSASSIRLNLQILTTMYAYLVQSGYLMQNPFSLIKRKAQPVVNKGIERYLTHKEWSYVIEFIEQMQKKSILQQQQYARTKWVFFLLYLTGCRRSEIVNARMSDFMNKHDNWWLKVIGKGNKYGEIPVTNDLLSALIDYRRSLKLSDYPSTIETQLPIVVSLKSGIGVYLPITDSMLYKLIKSTASKIATFVKIKDPAAAFVIEKVSTHWMRHTSATHQVDAGIDIRIVKENLRHSMLETTMKYQHTEDNARHNETNKKFGIK